MPSSWFPRGKAALTEGLRLPGGAHFSESPQPQRVLLLAHRPTPAHLCNFLHAWLCPTLCDPMDCSPPGFSVHEILQTRTLKWVALSFSRGSSRTRDGSNAYPALAGGLFTSWATWEAHPTCKSMATLPRARCVLTLKCIKLDTFCFSHIYVFDPLYHQWSPPNQH